MMKRSYIYSLLAMLIAVSASSQCRRYTCDGLTILLTDSGLEILHPAYWGTFTDPSANGRINDSVLTTIADCDASWINDSLICVRSKCTARQVVESLTIEASKDRKLKEGVRVVFDIPHFFQNLSISYSGGGVDMGSVFNYSTNNRTLQISGSLYNFGILGIEPQHKLVDWLNINSCSLIPSSILVMKEIAPLDDNNVITVHIPDLCVTFFQRYQIYDELMLVNDQRIFWRGMVFLRSDKPVYRTSSAEKNDTISSW